MSYVESMQALIHERYGLVLAFREISLPGNAEKSAFVRAVRAIDRRISDVRFWIRAHARSYIRCLANENRSQESQRRYENTLKKDREQKRQEKAQQKRLLRRQRRRLRRRRRF